VKPASVLLATALFVTAQLSGCTSYAMRAASEEQRAADTLRSAGATQAARAAQDRADKQTAAARCKDALECSMDVVGQVLLALIFASLSSGR
jgi:hypothetical protein